MAFFMYYQNNSGGTRDNSPQRGRGVLVWIEARDAMSADVKALNIGIYFDGVEEGIDCGCCGDRWDRAEQAGTDFPTYYGAPAEKVITSWLGKEGPIYVHPADNPFFEATVESLAAFRAERGAS